MVESLQQVRAVQSAEVDGFRSLYLSRHNADMIMCNNSMIIE